MNFKKDDIKRNVIGGYTWGPFHYVFTKERRTENGDTFDDYHCFLTCDNKDIVYESELVPLSLYTDFNHGDSEKLDIFFRDNAEAITEHFISDVLAYITLIDLPEDAFSEFEPCDDCDCGTDETKQQDELFGSSENDFERGCPENDFDCGLDVCDCDCLDGDDYDAEETQRQLDELFGSSDDDSDSDYFDPAEINDKYDIFPEAFKNESDVEYTEKASDEPASDIDEFDFDKIDELVTDGDCANGLGFDFVDYCCDGEKRDFDNIDDESNNDSFGVDEDGNIEKIIEPDDNDRRKVKELNFLLDLDKLLSKALEKVTDNEDDEADFIKKTKDKMKDDEADIIKKVDEIVKELHADGCDCDCDCQSCFRCDDCEDRDNIDRSFVLGNHRYLIDPINETDELNYERSNAIAIKSIKPEEEVNINHNLYSIREEFKNLGRAVFLVNYFEKE